jgi:hypothetical protein
MTFLVKVTLAYLNTNIVKEFKRSLGCVRNSVVSGWIASVLRFRVSTAIVTSAFNVMACRQASMQSSHSAAEAFVAVLTWGKTCSHGTQHTASSLTGIRQPAVSFVQQSVWGTTTTFPAQSAYTGHDCYLAPGEGGSLAALTEVELLALDEVGKGAIGTQLLEVQLVPAQSSGQKLGTNYPPPRALQHGILPYCGKHIRLIRA